MNTRNSGRVTVSLVAYEHPAEELRPLLELLERDPQVAAWIVVDNSAFESPEIAKELEEYVVAHGGRYLASSNVGFGSSHNRGFKALAGTPADVHLFVNPDIFYETGTLEQLVRVLDENPDVGRVMPKILYPGGRLQTLNKLLPTPFNLFGRRFLPGFLLNTVFRKAETNYEMEGAYDHVFRNVPFLSGCFVFLRRSLFETVGGFDERYFMYLEDAELTRVSGHVADSLYWPEVTIIHGYERGAHKNLRLTWIALRSSVAYFNKWGWFFDRERRRLNQAALRERDRILREK